uniref:Syntaxin N-terminal domain-containing protein n=1 Tax=Salmo trutta TaxID=8032 RepID=A0A674AFH2_SALTR
MNVLRIFYCWHDTGLMVALTLSSPDKLFSGCPKQSERGFIRENDFTPVVSSPIPVPFAEYQSVPDVFPGEKFRFLQDGVHSSKPALSAIRQHSDFTLMAKRIGKDLSNTFSKLEKLTILAKRKSLFDDKAVEVEELTYIVKQDINSLNKQIAQLQGLVRSRQSQNGKHLQTHSNTIIVSLQSKLASMSNDFKSMLEVRTEVRQHFTTPSQNTKLWNLWRLPPIEFQTLVEFMPGCIEAVLARGGQRPIKALCWSLL